MSYSRGTPPVGAGGGGGGVPGARMSDDGGAGGALLDGVGGLAPSLAREVAMIRCAFELARQTRRDDEACAKALLALCSQPAFAAEAVYRFRRGDEEVVGGSVVLAREAVRCYPHIHYGAAVLHEDDTSLHVEGWAYDLLTNRRIPYQDSFKKAIQRTEWVDGPDGKRQKRTTWKNTTDEREVRELLFRRVAFLIRNAIFGLIPHHVVEGAVAACVATAAKAAQPDAAQQAGGAPAVDAATKLARARDNVVQWARASELTDDQLAAWAGGVPVAQWDAQLLARFRQVATAIRDGQTTVGNEFDVVDDGALPSSLPPVPPAPGVARGAQPQ